MEGLEIIIIVLIVLAMIFLVIVGAVNVSINQHNVREYVPKVNVSVNLDALKGNVSTNTV